MNLPENQMYFTKLVRQHPAYSDCEIIRKENKYSDFQKEMAEIEQTYFQALNMAIYASLEAQENCKVFEVQRSADKLYVNFIACRMPANDSFADKFYLLWIRILDEELRDSLGKKYAILYFHSFSQSLFPYNFLKSIFKKLPLFYYAMLDRIYVIEFNPLLRSVASFFDFGRLHKLFIRKIEHIQTIEQLTSIPDIKKTRVLESLPSIFKLSLKEEKNTSPTSPTSPTAPTPPHPRHQPNDYLVIDLPNHKFTKDGQALTLAILFLSLKSRPHLLEVEGIFRKSGSMDEEQEIIDFMGEMKEVKVIDIIDDDSGYALAAVVKKFFTRLTSPIVPYSLYKKMMAQLNTTIRPEDELYFVQGFLMELPRLNQRIIYHLIGFLRDHVVTKSDKNKMTCTNLSICLCPCLFRSEVPTLEDFAYVGKFAGIILIMFNRFEELFAEERKGRGSRGSKGSQSNRKS